MENNKSALVKHIGEEKFDEELKVLKQMIEQEAEEQEFKAQQGDVDTRDDHLISEKLSDGYHNFCGFKGEKLSGGQK